MKKLFTLVCTLSTAVFVSAQQGPGLVISEILPNPAGTDSPFELVELVATRTINFATTPYSVVACNNGNATTAGWINGGAISYGFSITSGTVSAGDVVYVGGSGIVVSGQVLRSINTGTTNGDQFGAFSTSGVIGNGGSNADGIAVFDQPIAALTNATVPVDAVFYGTAIGSAIVNAGADGYQLPINDLYSGGKLQSTSFFGPDAGSAQYIVATGTFNPTSGAFTTGRSFALSATFTDNATSVALSSATPSISISFPGTNKFVNEGAGSTTVTVNVGGTPNNGQAVFILGALPYSTASTADYSSASFTRTIPAFIGGAQTITIPIVDDAIAEKDEYIALYFQVRYNATATATAVFYLYIQDNDNPAPLATNELFLDSLSTFVNGAPNPTNSAEIVAHDPSTQRLYIANSVGAKLDIVNFSNPLNPTLINSISISSYGNINSVAVNDSIVAMAIENSSNPQDSGKIVFLNYNGVFISQVKVGAMPDMITFNHAGTKVITACEGEPNNAYTNDPDGSVCIVDISGGVPSVTQANVSFVTFTSFNGQETSLRASGIRIYGVTGIASKDFEPEYVTVADNDSICWVTLQENNAMAIIDLQTNAVTQLIPLGYKNYMTSPAALDASDRTRGNGIALMNAPVYGMYQPDAISHYKIGNQVYLVTANEGDARAYSGLNEEARFNSLNLDPVLFPYAVQMKQDSFLGRLNCTNKTGDIDNDGDIDQVYTFGARSYSIWNGTTGAQVYDSGDQLERITAVDPYFNTSNSLGTTPVKNRSDDKGPEPEGTSVAEINGSYYNFLALERIGGIMMFNVTNPASPTYTGYYNNRTGANGDRGAEGILYIPDSLSPNGNAIVITANEVSSTLAVFQITTCADRAGITITPSSPSPVCAGNTVALTATSVANTTYQWYMNGSPIVGQTTASYTATASGDYQVMITNSTHACSGKTDFVNVTINPLPTVTATTSAATICNGSSATLTTSGAATYNWMPGNLNGSSVTVTPSSATTYTVTGTDANGCVNTATTSIAVNPLPSVGVTASNATICNGSSATLTGTGAASYGWMPGNLSGTSVTVAPSATTTYTVTGTDANGCANTSSVAITVNPTPTVTASTQFTTVCSGSNVTLTAGGATTYNWQPVNMNGTSILLNPAATATYTVTGTNASGCTNTASVTVTVLPRPTITVSSSLSTICSADPTTLTATGGASYTWLPGLLTGNPVTVTPSSTTTYTVTGSGTNGCNNTATLTITVNPSPTVTATASSNSICGPAAITLSSSGAATYNWMPGNLSGSTITDTPSSTTTYTVSGTAANGCARSNTVTVTVNTPPAVTLASIVPDTLCTYSPVATLNGSPAGGIYSGQGVNGSSFDAAMAGVGMHNIIYSYTDANGCSGNDTTAVFVDVCTDIVNAEPVEMNVTVIPNPNNGTFLINLENMVDGTQLVLINELGQIVDRYTIANGNSTMSVANLAKGFYILSAENAQQKIVRKIIVQ